MLYQLVVYASSQQNLRTATILYPATDRSATESRINISDPVFGTRLSQVCLRPVVLDNFEELILSGNVTAARRERVRFAQELAFGTSAPRT
jgi:5-methylcytosine-specific restriction enzyme subunit McrC